MAKIRVVVNDLMQQGYVLLSHGAGRRELPPDFRPQLTPKEMLELGVFGGRYMTDCRDEFPATWFRRAKLCPERHDPALNFFGINASQPLSVWATRRAGSTPTTRAAGSSGTAATTWAEPVPRRRAADSSAGGQCGGTSRRSRRTAAPAT